MKMHHPHMLISGVVQAGHGEESRGILPQNRVSAFFIVLGLHLLLLGLLLTVTPLRQSIVHLMHATTIVMPMDKVSILPVSSSPALASESKQASTPTPASDNEISRVSQTQSPVARIDESRTNPNAAALERDFPANPSPVLNVTNPVTISSEDTVASGATKQPEPEKNDILRIGETDNNVITITKLGSSKAEYIAPNFLSAQLEQTQFQVDVGEFEDIETAVVNQIITQIRTRYKKEIYWNSKIKARMVRFSMLPQDHAELEKFLKMEIFGKKKARDYSFWDKSKF